MTDPLLPPDIKVGSGLGLDEKPVVRVDLSLAGGDDIAFVLKPHHAWPLAMSLLDQDDRRVARWARSSCARPGFARKRHGEGCGLSGGSEA